MMKSYKTFMGQSNAPPQARISPSGSSMPNGDPKSPKPNFNEALPYLPFFIDKMEDITQLEFVGDELSTFMIVIFLITKIKIK